MDSWDLGSSYPDQHALFESSLFQELLNKGFSTFLGEPVADTPLPTRRECVIVSGYPEVSPAQDRIRFSCDQRQPDSVIFLCSTLHGLHRV